MVDYRQLSKQVHNSRVDNAGEIPVVITQEHNESLHFWLNFSDITLLHVDGHPDLSSHVTVRNSKNYSNVDIDNFICAAMYNGNVKSSVYWMNPHSEQFIKQFNLETFVEAKNGMEWVKWKNIESLADLLLGKSGVVTEFDDSEEWLLDIDLDAFCGRHIYNVKEGYDGISDYGSRIAKTEQYLTGLSTPELITITRSQGRGTGLNYVPSKMVDAVEEEVMVSLKNLYS